MRRNLCEGSRAHRFGAWLLGLPMAALIAGPAAVADDPQPTGTAEQSSAESRPAAEPTLFEVRFTDDSRLKLTLRDPQVGITTPYGNLTIPVADIQKIEFATRVSEEVAGQIKAAIADLGHADFRRRDAAMAALLRHRQRSYSALQEAAKQPDPEAARRAGELLDKLRAMVPEDELKPRLQDVVHTADSRFTGRLEGESLPAETAQFGAVQLRLHDLRCLHALKTSTRPGQSLVAAQPDPGTLQAFGNQMGESFIFRVTGGQNAAVWGTARYTTDSNLATAAVHAGALRPGESGLVRVRIVPSPPAFQASTRNGVTSGAWGPYPSAFEVSRVEETAAGC